MMMRRSTRLFIAVAIALNFVTLIHSLEDERYGVFSRFHVSTLAGAGAVALASTLLLVGTWSAAGGSRWGRVLCVALGLLWALGALLDHGRDIIFTWPYRAGVISKALEVAIILLGLAIAAFGATPTLLRRRSAPNRFRLPIRVGK